jgi:Carboxypeptidase regulatory-like domain
MKTKFGGIIVVFLLAMTLRLVPTHAQEAASLTGVVTDNSGATVSGVALKLLDARTGTVYTAKTGELGDYKFLKLPPGPGYLLIATKDGFQTITLSSLYLPIATTTTQNLQLAVGAVSQTVEVKSEGSVSLNTTDITIGNTFDNRAISSLPNEFRGNAANLLRLEPGVVSANATNNLDDAGGNRNGSVAGARADQDNITVDGIDASDFGVGQAFHQVAATPVDAIQEFRTEVANPLADTGRGSGAQTIITTKSGTNQWHGDAREYHRNTITEANDFFNNSSGVPRPTLIRNQFGGNIGGPIKKDKLFFFFDYDGRRDASQVPVNAVVPLDHVRQGGIAYINNNPGCTSTATLASAPNCITTLSPQQVAALDPCSQAGACPGVTPGFNQAILNLFDTRYPHSNSTAGGDGINTGGLFFNAPNPNTVNTYTTRVDYNISAAQKLFVRFNFFNQHTTNPLFPSSIVLPGDPLSYPLTTFDKSWAIGHTWTFSPNLVNQFVYGEARSEFNGISTLTGQANPGGNAGVYVGLNWLFPTGIQSPYARPGGNAGVNPIPTFRDDVTYLHGKHSFQFGGVFKPIRTRSILVNNLYFIEAGLLTNPALDSTVRPANILQDPNGVAASFWDSAFTGFLGVAPVQFNVLNFYKNGNLTPEGAGQRRDYRYYESEAYAQDTWRIRSDLTVTAGLRYSFDSVPYETNGLEATPNVDWQDLVSNRVANGLAGVSGPLAAPLLTYTLAGKGNPGGQPLYQANPLNFSPRLAVAWNPAYRNGLLGSVLGDRKTVLRFGAAQIFDHVALSAVNFAEDQSNYIYGTNTSSFFSGQTAAQFLTTSPRFTAVNQPVVAPIIPPFATTVTPFTSGSGSTLQVFGTNTGQFNNYAIDSHLKTPYSLAYSVGLQRELPGSFQLELDYIGRFGRRLTEAGDGGQLIDFVDPGSKQSLVNAVSTLETEARQGAGGVPVGQIQPLPFFENQVAAAVGQSCATFAPTQGPFTNCTQLVYAGNQVPLAQGNTFNVVRQELQNGFLLPGVGLSPQWASNYYFGNKAYSSYNGLIAILRKRLSRNLQMDFNYTFSHSIDNVSTVANNNGNPANNAQSILCDSINLSVCKGNSEFDVTHQVSSDVIYDLPFGRGQWIARNSSSWLNQIIGGWQASGIVTWRTGFAFPVQSSVSTVVFDSAAYPLFNGDKSALAVRPHFDPNVGGIQLFANPTAALAAFSAPTGLQVGSRDELRGPHFSNTDLALSKNFSLFSEKYKLQFRAEAYNAFNHPNFALPLNINFQGTNFGQITSTTSTSGDQSARVLQFALRLDF